MLRSRPIIALFTLAAASCASPGGAPPQSPAASAPPSPPALPTIVSTSVTPSPAAASPGPETWITRSNANAKLLIDLAIKYAPEQAAESGVEGFDDQILDYREGHDARSRADLAVIKTELEARAAKEADPLVKQDLAILIAATERSIRGSSIHEQYEVPFLNVAEYVFNTLQRLLDDQIAPARRAASAMRMRRYAGMEPGTRPLTELARTETTAKLAAPGHMPPSRLTIEKALQTGDVLVDGIEKLYVKYAIAGYEEPLRAFKQQIAAYQDWLRKDVLPRSRDDFRLAPQVYALSLEEFGVKSTPEELIKLGHEGFTAIQAEMKKVAVVVARERHLPNADYREVVKALKREQVVGDAILPLYEKRLADIEAIIRREHLVTLPNRAMRIRLATPAESAQQPAPYFNAARLIGNTGEQGEFILPLTVPPAPGTKEKEVKLDDFTYSAVSWTLTAHEARPGHELQFASMIERGVSLARGMFAFNSANVEGWGLYAESITLPYMPAEGQLVSLQLRLGRAAREFLDPELQLGKVTPQAARAFLEKEIGYSKAFANSEVERYTFRAPGQATSYFFGFTRLVELRRELEAKLGSRFNLQRFDDWVISQGMLPPDVLREAALRELAGS
jgi:uncharacterized protein (DUF885 family)